ncbi:ATP-binding protein [Nocardiopsis lambiniae]|uniref:ATP-binding protein n=1 Tax=Nocardiopsis lambiniae TaxID=3075539 RepID=A0ABU2MEA5_9ACTN|nr:ATP-binding protein [Nocardiopsis sp. DSM 44743]MDT0331022.1 ATP-binding protein [Nocardiopsis sp. DSM 44743]
MFPGHVDEIARVRTFVRALLQDHPTGDDAVLIASELATNALRHTRSSGDGGMFVVRINDHGDRVRIAVVDYGSNHDWDGKIVSPEPWTEHGRGLVLVDALAKQWGVVPEPVGTCVWADLATYLKL